ncbi:MAG: PLP-dependent aminotransferase family protein [Spirochaetaceae bacterium]|nr:PLP-dependent aminotransferase family protein [Myxococcales bacterium]MCB9723323.1 PLP-dependent aminotransferase family protein [Spirochaetaceae bacterium]
MSTRPAAPRRRRDGGNLRDLPLDGDGPLYGQIYRAMRAAILAGRARPGVRLPTTRALARELGCSRNTVVAAFEPLRAEGYVVTRVGAGTFVTAPPSPATSRPAGAPTSAPVSLGAPAAAPVLSRYGRALRDGDPRRVYDGALASSAPPWDFRPCVPELEDLSYDAWRRQLVRTAHHLPTRAFDYADPAGDPTLRETIAAYLARARGVECRAEDVLVVGGVAQALDLASRLLLDAGDGVLLEDPHYLGARRVFEAAGARLVGAPVDGEGVDLGAVAAERLAGCRLAYVTPSHQFPTGSVLSLGRRLALLDWATAANAFVIEDDYDSEFRYAGRAIPSMKSLDTAGRVIYVGTFSKTLLPSLRIAYVVAPPPLAPLFRTAKWMADWSAPGFEQAALARFLETGEFERHLRRARTLYAERRAALVEALAERAGVFRPVWRDSQAGLHLLVRFPEWPATRIDALLRAARERGLGLYPAAPCYLERAPDALELVMGFGRLSPARLCEGVSKLAELLAAPAPARASDPPPARPGHPAADRGWSEKKP